MKKFSKIVENVDNKITDDPKKSIQRILDYMNDGGEAGNFDEYISDILVGEEQNEFSEIFWDRCDNFEEFKSLIEKFDLEKVATDHIYYHLMVVQDFINKLPDTGSYRKKINEN